MKQRKKTFIRFAATMASFVMLLALMVSPLSANEVKKIHFLIPGGAGGGWDGTARGVGKALLDTNLLEQASFENMSGGGGGKALNHLISTAKRQEGTLLVNSTPIIIRSLTGVFPQSFRDLTPIASVIADYAAFVVPKDSKYTGFKQVVADFQKDPKSVKIGGGSVRGSMDHLVPAMVFQAAGEDPLKVKYIPYDAGGKAMAGLLSGDVQVLSTGFGEALGLANQGEVRILAVTSAERLSQAPDVPTVKELGYDVTFANWRGFFGVPGLSKEKAEAYRALLKKMCDTPSGKQSVLNAAGRISISPVMNFMHFLKLRKRILAI